MKCKTKEDYKALLHKSNLKATDERLFVIELFGIAKSPQTVPQILKKCKNLKMHESTLYRIISIFQEKKLIKKIDFRENISRYEFVDHEDDHHHIVCTKCKKVSDFTGCDADKIIKRALAQAKDFKKITTHSFELFGLCKKCG